MRLFTYILLLASICSLQSCDKLLQPDMIGWIPFDPTLDDTNFQLCDEAAARGGRVHYPRYKEGKRDLKQYFMQNVQLPNPNGQNGHIVIRFLVNCKGNAGRFRMEQLGRDYKAREFAVHIPQTILQTMQEIDNWYLPEGMDGYGFVTFKIEDGQLVDVI